VAWDVSVAAASVLGRAGRARAYVPPPSLGAADSKADLVAPGEPGRPGQGRGEARPGLQPGADRRRPCAVRHLEPGRAEGGQRLRRRREDVRGASQCLQGECDAASICRRASC